MEEPLSCLQCGKCCFVDLTANAQQEDFNSENFYTNIQMVLKRDYC
jgi:hypothetical protein